MAFRHRALLRFNPEINLSWYFLVTRKLRIEYPIAVCLAVCNTPAEMGDSFMTQARKI